jgi:outer membrane protein
MAYAVENSVDTRNQRYMNDNYRQEVIAAVGSMLPSVRGSSSAGWNFGRSIDTETNDVVNTSNFDNSYSLSGSIPLFSGLTRVNQLRSARIARLRGTEELQKAQDDIAIQTLQAYVDVVYYTEAVRIAEEQLEESRRNLYSTERQAELGLKGRPDVAQFEAEVAGYEFTMMKQQNLLNTALLHLKDRMNYPFEEPLAIAGDIPSHSGIFEESAAEIFAEARNRLPGARIADFQLRETELSLAMARGQYFPSLSASGSINTGFNKNLQSTDSTAPFREQLENKLGQSVGLSLSIPIFGGLSQRTRVARARNNLRIAEQNHGEALRQIQREIEQAVMDVEGSAKEYAQAIRKTAATGEAHRANQRKFEEGLISALELQNSTNLLLQARVEELNVRLRYRIQCRLLDFYKGIPLI